MKFRTRLSVMTLESRENPSGPALVPPYTTGAPPAASGPATTGAATTAGGASIASSGTVSIATQIGAAVLGGATSSSTTTNTGILGNNSITGQPLLESTLLNN